MKNKRIFYIAILSIFAIIATYFLCNVVKNTTNSSLATEVVKPTVNPNGYDFSGKIESKGTLDEKTAIYTVEVLSDVPSTLYPPGKRVTVVKVRSSNLDYKSGPRYIYKFHATYDINTDMYDAVTVGITRQPGGDQ